MSYLNECIYKEKCPSETMGYLICKKCGNHYRLEEGKSSFYFERCECGGKLRYSPTPELDNPLDQLKSHERPLHENGMGNQATRKIRWKGILLGFAFLFISLMISVMVLFGTKVPSSISAVNFQDLAIFSIISVVFTVASGFLSSYLGGSSKFKEGALNGGMVGVILAIMLGALGGVAVLISAIAVFGSLSMIGGIVGSLLRR